MSREKMTINRGGFWIPLLGSICCLLLVSCGKPELKVEKEKVSFPYKRIAKGDDNPGDYGPDDETVLNAIDGKYPPVPFSHFTHSSNADDGYGIDCLVCHHDAQTADDATTCTECHEPGDGADEALLGPDDNLRLEMKPQTITSTPFSHYTHASFQETGYRIGCHRCHHVAGDYSPCGTCHKELALPGDDGLTIPKLKRAFHMQCRDCHILSKNKKAPITCEGCHRPMKYIKSEDVLPLSRSYHVMCINCHQQVNDSAGKHAPVKCIGCHVPPTK
ncbi:MAG: cytochrome c3 family protein [Deltaproteobacteria bacterium]|nr:cytochrome c3 family protein [Deltaproteobacteria bacterium]